jgi:hypothetical protein
MQEKKSRDIRLLNKDISSSTTCVCILRLPNSDSTNKGLTQNKKLLNIACVHILTFRKEVKTYIHICFNITSTKSMAHGSQHGFLDCSSIPLARWDWYAAASHHAPPPPSIYLPRASSWRHQSPTIYKISVQWLKNRTQKSVYMQTSTWERF